MAEDHEQDERPGPSKEAAEENGDKEAPDDVQAKRDGSDSDLTAEQPPEPPFYTPGCLSTTQEEEAAAAAAAAAEPEEGGVTCANRAYLAWVLCGVGAAIIVVPLAFILLPLLFPLDGGRAVDRAVVSPSKEEAEDGAHVRIPEVIASSCILHSPEIPGDLSDVRSEEYAAKPNVTDKTPKEFFCLYNNSRYHNPPGRNFLPMHVPFSLCPSLVYWSMAVTDGSVTSRNKKFDEQYGLYKLREISKAELNKTKEVAFLLMTIGGYPEDSGHFHRLAANYTVRHRLVSSVYKESLKHALNGTNVHWVQGSESCEVDLRQERWRTLIRFLDDVRALLSLNEFPGNFSLTVMIDPHDVPDVTVLKDMKSKTNAVFLTTHLLRPTKNSLPEYCEKTPMMVRDFLIDMLEKITAEKNSTALGRVCVSATLGVPAWASVSEPVPAPAFPISKTEGKVAMSDVCNNQKIAFTKDKSSGACDVYTAKVGERDLYFAMDNNASVKTKYRAVKNMCMLVYDIDFDNFFDRCEKQELFLRLRYYLEAFKPAGNVDSSPLAV